jgi:pyruvate formate lyase activating enzyme
MKAALLYEQIDKKRVRCLLCAHRCVIAEGKNGVCEVRRNSGGFLYTLVYGRSISQHVDPIEKKPLYHFYPGSNAYSIATPGCNFRCQWCQNWDIAHMPRERGIIAGHNAAPELIVQDARANECRSIAYTYTEPTIFFEYAFDVSKLARAAGIANVFVTNGYMTAEMLETYYPYLDAANVDLKAFREKTYHRYVGAGLKTMKKQGVWVEVTTLVIPGINDEPDELRDAARFISQELGSDTPWHISRFFPSYQMSDRPATPMATMIKVRDIGLQEGLRYVYLGNVREESNTNCYSCGHILIRRAAYWIAENNIQSGRCPQCGVEIAGVWDK